MITFPIGFYKGASGGSFENVYSIDFDGVDDYVDISAISGVSDPATISFWLNPTSVGILYGGLFSSENYFQSPNTNTFSIQLSGNKIRYVGYNNGSFDAFQYNGYTAAVGTWAHIALTLSGTTLKLYIDGSLADTYTITSGGTWANLSNGAYIGKDRLTEAAAIIDEVSIFDAELSASDIFLTGHSNLQGWWRMGDGATFPTIPDDSSNSNDGTMTNMVAGDIVADVPT